VENYDAPPGLSQTSRITNDDEVEDNFFDSMLDDDIFAIIDGIPLKHELDTNHTKNPYGYLKQYFTEKIDIFEVNCTMEELINVKNKFMVITDSKRKKIYDNISSNTAEHNNITGVLEISADCVYVSSDVPCETKNNTRNSTLLIISTSIQCLFEHYYSYKFHISILNGKP